MFSFFTLLPSWTTLLASAFVMELVFYAVFVYVLVPRCDRLTPPRPYRDYGNCRHKLLERILDRIDRTSLFQKKKLRHGFKDFFSSWFRKLDGMPGLERLSSTDVSSDEDEDIDESTEWNMQGLCKEEADEFLTWAFFGKPPDSLEPWEQQEFSEIHKIVANRYGVTFPDRRGKVYQSRRLTLENCNALYRPLLLYFFFYSAGLIGDIYLRLVGFGRYKTASGLVYWYRRGKNHGERLPLLFFHGIAPAGKTFYIPLALCALGGRDRCIFMFENPSISSAICFEALSEDETVWGVQEALDRHLESHTPLSLCGHSFGSCPMTWLLRSSIRNRIRQYVLLDPVSIVLSEPDVMLNFLYARLEEKGTSKIDVVAGSELFTINYLRRHFSWYNSELWLEDIPDDTQVLICLSELDEIISTKKVRREIEMKPPKNLDLIHWDGVGHAHCITAADVWPEIRNKLLEQEETLLSTKLD